MKIKDTYTLIKTDIPKIVDGQVVSDPGVGGIKLVYWKRRIVYKDVYFSFIKISYPISISKRSKVVFLRPFKDKWDTQRNRLAINYWGKKNNPLTNMWIVVESDYKHWSDTAVRFKDQVTDHTLLKELKATSEEFTVIVNQKSKTQ